MGNYFGSALNEFIADKCPHTFTIINIDCLQLRWESKTLRIIEYKHDNEPLGKQQYKSLKFLADRFSNIIFGVWKFEVYIAYGNFPYDTLVLKDLIRNRTFKIKTQQDVINWLSFKSDLEDISEEITLLAENGLYDKNLPGVYEESLDDLFRRKVLESPGYIFSRPCWCYLWNTRILPDRW